MRQTDRLTSEYEAAQHIARARTLTILPRLDRQRKRSVLLFLYEAHLINLFDWSSADLTEAALSDTTFRRANLSGAKLRGADLSGADLSEANLSRADLGGANLAGTNLQRADLNGAKFDGAKLHGANLSEANLHDADLSNANLSKTICWGAKTRLERHRQVIDDSLKRGGSMWRQILRPKVNARSVLDMLLGQSSITITFKNGTNLRGANLRRANLRGADLSEVNLEKAHLNETDLTQVNLTRANLKAANLTGTTMSRVKRTVTVIPLLNWEVKVRTEHLQWADLENGGCSFSEVLSPKDRRNLLKKSGSPKARLIAIDFKPFRLKVIKLEAEATNLQEADLIDADLTGVDLSGVNLCKALITPEQLEATQSLKGAILPNGSKHSW